MSEKLVKGILGTFGGLTSIAFGKELLVFIISLLPILELRGGLLAAALLGLDPIPSYIISIVGNLLPIPFILLLINKILDKMRNGKKSKKKKRTNRKIWIFGISFICWNTTSRYRSMDRIINRIST